VILTGLGVSGVVTTAYLAARAGYTHGRREAPYDGHMDPIKDRIKLHWRCYIPTVVTGVVTIGCVVAATHVGLRRTAAMAAAYSVSEKAFTEYRDKVEEKYGKNKETAIRDEIAQDKVTANPPGPGIVYVGGGNVLCYEFYTGRYFLSDMETLKQAQNEVNDRILRCEYATLAEFHTLIGQPATQGAQDVGWDREKLLVLEFTSVLVNDNKPALSFGYNYLKAL
jgi:hypothetical protein